MFVLSLVKKHYRLQFYMVGALMHSGSPRKWDQRSSLTTELSAASLFLNVCVALPPPQFGWTHVTLLIVVTQSHLIIHNLFEGMIWSVTCTLHTSPPEPDGALKLLQSVSLGRFIVPISCVICNDIMAYMFGFFFGRTPLIKVGPL